MAVNKAIKQYKEQLFDSKLAIASIEQIPPERRSQGQVEALGVLRTFKVYLDSAIKALEAAMQGSKFLCVVAQKQIQLEDPQASDLYSTGVLVEVVQFLKILWPFICHYFQL